jgi:hypothetical protein
VRENIELVLDLQKQWESGNTPAMKMRGEVIRNAIPEELKHSLDELILRVPAALGDIKVRGKDATGRKSEVPWVRVFSAARSPRATDGWYLVYLFDAFGDAAYLSINQGTTKWDGREFRARPKAQLIERATWARDLLADQAESRQDLTDSITLPTRKSSLARGYEYGNVFSLQYERGAIPDDAVLLADFKYMAGLLTDLYEFADSALSIPGDPEPEVLDAIEFADFAAGKRRNGGFRLNAAERLVIERRAVDATAGYLHFKGYQVKDVGATKSYDLHARRDEEEVLVEVKGTVSIGHDVILTRKEVALHQEKFPSNMLAVLSNINLDRDGMTPIASGGNLRVWKPWSLDSKSLEALSYTYSVPGAAEDIGDQF